MSEFCQRCSYCLSVLYPSTWKSSSQTLFQIVPPESFSDADVITHSGLFNVANNQREIEIWFYLYFHSQLTSLETDTLDVQ